MLSIVICFYNNCREALNSLHSLSRNYQIEAHDIAYEVIAVDNGSSQPLSAEAVRAFGPEFSYRYVQTRSVSPATAMNTACREAAGDQLLVSIDGAHILSPGIFRLASTAFGDYPSPFIATVPFHLGPKVQNQSVLEGYNQQVEDALLQQSGWKENGYRLYEVAGALSGPSGGWYGCLFESGCFGIRKADFLSLGGFDERFQSRGGGLVNLDLFQRAVSREDLQYVMLLGEGTFHQVHGGVSSNVPRSQHPWDEFHQEYVQIRGKPFQRVRRTPVFLGRLPNEVLQNAKLASQMGLGAWEKKQAVGNAVAYFQEALRQRPNDPEAYYRLGVALDKQYRGIEAVLCLRQAVRLKLDFADAHKALGDALRAHLDTPVDEAISCYRTAIHLKPEDAEAHHMLGRTLKELGLLDEAVSALRRACQLRPDSAEFHSSLLYCLHYHPDTNPGFLVEEHERWNRLHAEPLTALSQPHANDPDPNRRLRIGYVSPYFRNHSVGRFLLPLVEAHDRRQFEVYCYTSMRGNDEVTTRFRSHADGWHEIYGMSDEDLADLIRQDRIDILLDLDAHTATNRLLAFARKPAPVQVTYLAYCSTTGMRVMDYRITDPFLDPVEQPARYPEASVWLPETYWCYQPMPDLPPVEALPALASGCLTFGCLNNFWKVTVPTLTVWRDLLQAVPGSRLLLHARPGSHQDRVRAFFAERGIDAGRIEFAGVLPPVRFFALYGQIDIGLDPFPFPGGTTTCDALWMGVPVISLAGRTSVSRGGVSILSNVGLPELIARTPGEYKRIALDLAADLPRLAALRAGLRERMQCSPLMDAPRFVQNMETAFRSMWRRWCDKAPVDETVGCWDGVDESRAVQARQLRTG
jgi:predicted O-linked N-acetylglucosamine transferase (SPINDLY family)